MLLNLSNHPLGQWNDEQIGTALNTYTQVVDVEFPQVDPAADEGEVLALAKQYAEKCMEILSKAETAKQAVHVMGELTFVFSIVNLLQEKGITCLASTTQRFVTNDENGNKLSQFNFVRFRKYPKISKL